VVVVVVVAGLAGCTADPPPAALPAPPVAAPAAAPPSTAVPPDDRHPARPDPVAGRTRSTAAGSSPLTIRSRPPAGRARAEVYDAYLRWLRAYLGVYAQPELRTDPLAGLATPAVRAGIRTHIARLAALGYAEYGPVAASVRVGAVTPGRSASVQACLDLSRVAMRDAAGRLDYYETRKLVTTSLIWLNSRWLIAGDVKRSVTRC
jgi:hypothetical protein